MSTYKEVLLTLPSNNKFENNISQNFLPFQNSISSIKNNKSFGETLSLPHHMIYVIAMDNIITIKTINTMNITINSEVEFTSSFSFTVNSNILENLTLLKYFNDDYHYILIFFTSNNTVYFNIMNAETNKSEVNLMYDLKNNFESSSVEFIGFSNNGIFNFILGNSNGNLMYLNLLYDTNKNSLSNNVKYINTQQKGFFENFSNRFNYFKNNNEVENIGINSMKYIGNDLICFIRCNFVFEVFNIKKEKKIFSMNFTENKNNNEILSSSKILFQVSETTLSEFQLGQKKIFNIMLYFNSQINYSLITFDLWFCNIPNINSKIISTDLNLFYNSIDLGDEVKLVNKRINILPGIIIDMTIKDEKLWIIMQIKNSNLIQCKYDIKIINIDSSSEENEFIDELLYGYNNFSSVDFLEKKLLNLFYMIKQINLNSSISNLKHNKIFISILSNEEYLSNESLINFINMKFSENFQSKKKVIQFLKDLYINNNENNKSLYQEIIMPMILDELNNNSIISIGSFENLDIKSVVLLRQKGISLLKNVGAFERIEQIIFNYEIQLRKIICNTQYNIFDTYSLEKEVSVYIHNEITTNDINSLFLSLALIRIYMTEVNLFSSNEDYLNKKFSDEKDLNNFIINVIGNKVNIQYNSCNNIEFIHEILNDIFLNHRNEILTYMQIIINQYNKMFKEASFKNNNLDIRMSENEYNKIINSKYCEIISKLVLNHITSLYHISRDLICLIQWRKNNIPLEDLFAEENFQNKYNLISKIDDDIKNFFTESFILYIISKHLTYFNTDIVSKIPKSTLNNSLRYKDMEVSCLEYLVFDKFSEFGNDILAQKKNDYINFTISSLLYDLFVINKNPGNNSFILKMLLDNKDYNFIILITLMTKTENLKINSLRLRIISNYNLGNKEETKKLLREYFIYAKSKNHLENIENDFDDFQKYINNENLTDFYFLGFQFLFPIYENYFNNPDLEQIDIYNKNKEKINIFIGKLFDSCFLNDPESVLILYAMLKNNKNIYFVVENCIIEKFQNYLLFSYQKIINSENPNDNFFISKLIIYDYELLLKVCLKIENELKNNYKNININNEGGNVDFELDKFKALIFCYSKMKEYQRLTEISHFYSKLIDGMIETDSLNLDNILLLLKEKISALNNSIIGCQRRKDSIKYLDIYEYEKEKVIAENKYLIIEFYLTTTNNKIKEIINEDSIAMIKNGRINMLNMIFKLKLYSMAIKTNLVKYLPLNEAELFTFNMIKSLKKENEKKLLSLFINKITRDNICDITQSKLYNLISEKFNK